MSNGYGIEDDDFDDGYGYEDDSFDADIPEGFDIGSAIEEDTRSIDSYSNDDNIYASVDQTFEDDAEKFLNSQFSGTASLGSSRAQNKTEKDYQPSVLRQKFRNTGSENTPKNTPSNSTRAGYVNYLNETDLYGTGDILEEDIERASHQEGMGMISPYTFQMERILNMSYGVQQSIVDMINEPDLFANRNYNEEVGITKNSMQEGLEEFGNIIGSDPKAFARDLGRRIPEGIEASQHRIDINTAFSMVNLTADSKMQKGKGQPLIGDTFTDKQQKKRDDRLTEATYLLDIYSELYLHPETKNSSIYGRRQQEVKSAIVDRMLNSPTMGVKKIDYTTGLQATDKTTGDPIFTNSLVPLPNELGVRGLIPVQSESMGYYLGSPHTRLSFSGMFPDEDKLWEDPTKKIGYQADVYANSPAGQYSKDQLEKLAPNVGKTFFGRVKGDSTSLYGQMKDDFKFIREVLREEALTSSDENMENTRRAVNQLDKFGDNSNIGETLNLRNEAALLDLDYTTEGNRETSEQQDFITDRSNYIDNNFKENDELKSEFVGPSPPTDMVRYSHRIATNKPPEQGSPEWLAEREGLITASVVGDLLKSGGVESTANKMNEKLLDNFYLNRGKEGEAWVLDQFKRFTGLQTQEAFLEKGTKELEGFGASPDAYAFDKYGKGQGIVELKYVNSNERLEESYKKYYNQAQLQMAVTGEKKVHFFRVNAYTEQHLYDVIEEDKEVQKQLISRGREVHEYLESDMTKPYISAAEQAEINRIESLEEEAKVYNDKDKSTSNATVFNDRATYIKDFKGKDPIGYARLEADKMNTIFDAKEDKKIDKVLNKMSNKEDREAKELLKKNTKAIKEGTKSRAEETKKRKAWSDKLNRRLKDFARVTSRFASAGIEGVTSQMADVRLSATLGMESGDYRGKIRYLTQDLGLTENQSRQAMEDAAQLQMRFIRDPGNTTRDITANMAKSGFEGDINIDPVAMMKGSVADVLARIMEMSNSMGRRDKAIFLRNTIGTMGNTNELFDSDKFNLAYSPVEDNSAIKEHAAIKGMDYKVQEVLEQYSNTLGEAGNSAAALVGHVDRLGYVVGGLVGTAIAFKGAVDSSNTSQDSSGKGIIRKTIGNVTRDPRMTKQMNIRDEANIELDQLYKDRDDIDFSDKTKWYDFMFPTDQENMDRINNEIYRTMEKKDKAEENIKKLNSNIEANITIVDKTSGGVVVATSEIQQNENAYA